MDKNRVRCRVRLAQKGQDEEALYLLPSQECLILVRPDEQKPFWAVHVISEPLRMTRVQAVKPLEQIASRDANSDELQRTLRLEVARPRSPCLKAAALLAGGFGLPLQTPLTLVFADERRR